MLFIPTNKHILFSCLNWGRGHLSRSIGVIRELITANNTIFFAGNEEQTSVINSYFPDITTFLINDYPFKFSGTGNFANDLFQSRTELVKHIGWEKNWVKKIISENPNVDLIISDHRYGFCHPTVKSVFMTHQVNLAISWWQFPAQFLHKLLYSVFNEVWILDDENNSLAGKLSKAPKNNKFKYIGHFSRFSELNTNEKSIQLGVVNGPHPYSDKLFNAFLEKPEIDTIIVPEVLYYKSLDRRLVNALDWKESDSLFYSAKCIHSYCGYSTLMDIKILACDAEVKPTPGQLEQEYLYKLHYGKKKR